MGLFGRLLGREKPRWQENWAVFPGDADDLFAMYCVDLGAVAAAPIDGLPIRLDVEVRFAAREDGMPADGHLMVVQRFEEVISAEARDRRGAYVGRMIVDGLCRYTTYLPSVPVGPLALPRDDFSPVVTTTADPGWAYLRDELGPDSEQWHIIRDMGVVRALLDHGDQLEQERPVDFEAHFDQRVSAEAAGAELRLDGFVVRIEATPQRDFRLEAVRSEPVEPPRIHKVTCSVREVVERRGGRYDGWGCLVVTGR